MSEQELGLYANRNKYKDFVVNPITHLSADGSNVFIAVAFFTEADVVQDLLAVGCHTRLIVRLGFPTSPHALQRLLGRPGLEIRYFTGSAFHPKIYIFGDKAALVGSANLTKAAIHSNQEVVVSISSEDPRFTSLVTLFADYWDEAKVLNSEAIATYKSIFEKYEKVQRHVDELETEVLNKLGSFAPSNIVRDKVKSSKENIFLEEFRKTYQECVSAFNIVREAYVESGYRKAPPSKIPLRIEIDSFISFVRERKAGGDSWMAAPLRSAAEQRKVISSLIEEWKSMPWPHFEDKVISETYPRLMRTFKSAASISAATDDDLFTALCTLHSFYDRLRFYAGGMPTWKATFLSANDSVRVRETLSYLVFGSGSIESRMASAIYDSQYKLNEFGQSNVQELIGWCNREEMPVINGRTTKVLRYFGSAVRQL